MPLVKPIGLSPGTAGIVTVDRRGYVVVAVTSGWPSGAATRAKPVLAGVGTAVSAYVQGRAG